MNKDIIQKARDIQNRIVKFVGKEAVIESVVRKAWQHMKQGAVVKDNVQGSSQ